MIGGMTNATRFLMMLTEWPRYVGVFNGGELFLGVYWMDGAEVVGPCKSHSSWPVEYRGLSKTDALTWLEDYCGW